MKIDLTQLSIQELVNLKQDITSQIYMFEDGYEYICNVRSYGRHWKEHISNPYSLQELCYQYFGEYGIVDVYSTNPDLSKLENYGDTMYIRSVNDYHKWTEHEYLVRQIPELEKKWEEWDNRDNVPFNHRPHFAPIYSKEDIQDMKVKLENFDMSFVPPRSYNSPEE